VCLQADRVSICVRRRSGHLSAVKRLLVRSDFSEHLFGCTIDWMSNIDLVSKSWLLISCVSRGSTILLAIHSSFVVTVLVFLRVLLFSFPPCCVLAFVPMRRIEILLQSNRHHRSTCSCKPIYSTSPQTSTTHHRNTSFFEI